MATEIGETRIEPPVRSSRSPGTVASSTTDDIAGREIVETFSPVWAITTVEASPAGPKAALLAALTAAHADLLAHALKIGADAVVGVRLETATGFALAYGTAVRTRALPMAMSAPEPAPGL